MKVPQLELVVLMLAASFGCFGQASFPDAKVVAGAGLIVFRQITLVNDGKSCALKSTVENLSDSSLQYVELMGTVKGPALRVEFSLERFSVPALSKVSYSSRCPLNAPRSGILSLSYVRGLTILPEGKNENQTRLLTQYLWSLPTVVSNVGTVLLAADKSCAKSFGKASDAGGLEGRKSVSEMQQLGCGQLIESGDWVRVNGESDGYLFVEVDEVTAVRDKKSGWIERRFLAPPKEYSLEAEMARVARRRALPESKRGPVVRQSDGPKPEKEWRVVDIESRVTESNEIWSRVAWRLTLENRSERTVVFEGSIDFEDDDGFIVDADGVFDLAVGAGESKVFTGAKLIKAESIGKLKGVHAKVAPR